MSVAFADCTTPRVLNSSFEQLSRAHRDELTQQLLARRQCEHDPAERRRLRDAIVLINLPLAEALAAKYRGLGVEWDDLSQVAKLGLIEAVDRFNPDQGSRFTKFAIPTISGEVKRYFRDRCWTIRPPRSVQENRSSVSRCRLRLTQSLGHPPTVAELAAALGMDESAVAEACASWEYFRPDSLDRPVRPGSELTLGAMVGHDDPRLDNVDNHETLVAVLNGLTHRERLLLVLRFEEGLSQSQIAARLGISQMQVCRRLRTLLGRLRDDLTNGTYDTQSRTPKARTACDRGRTATSSPIPRGTLGRCGSVVRTAGRNETAHRRSGRPV